MKGWRTVAFNALAALVPVIEAAGVDLGLNGQNLVYYTLGITVLNTVLRFFTTGPIGSNK